MQKCLCSRDLNNLITVQRLKNSQTLDDGGQSDETVDANWMNAGQEYCQFLTQGSREFFRGEDVAADITHQVTMRWSKKAAGYTTRMRLMMDGRKFNIAAPPRNVDERNEWLVFPVIEIK